MDAPTFIQKWSKANLSEQAASQKHFLDLCRLLGVKTPAELDPVGDTFTFEKGAKVSAPASLGSKGDRGRADVWYKGRFAWEYKRQGKHKALEAAYQQLQQYREGLENPPLLIVCDINRTEIHTNFTGYKPEVHTILLEDFAAPGTIPRLRQIFTDPEAFKPKETVAEITVKVALGFGEIASELRARRQNHKPRCLMDLQASDCDEEFLAGVVAEIDTQTGLTSTARPATLAGKKRYQEFPEVRMPQLLLRDIPDELSDWIKDQSHGLRTTKKEFVLSVLSRAAQREGERSRSVEVDDPSNARANDGVPFTFIDLFAGIGGFRIGLEEVGGRCVFTSEWDKYAQKTYRSWFGDLPEGDIREVNPAKIPDHDVLAAGFPCQPFSIAGVSKKASLGREHGFRDVTQGTLFFHLAAIIEAKRPPVFILENVKNLKSHDRGQTWKVISTTLDNLGYRVHSKVIDAAGWVPQHRERVFIVGFDKQVFGEEGPSFSFPEPPVGQAPKFRDILDPKTPAKYTLTDHLWNYLQGYAAKHKAKGNGFGFGMTDLDGVSRTLSARYYKDGSEVLIPQARGKNPRRLSPREAARLMGFPDELPIVVSDTQAYKQFGNSVSPPVVEAVGRELVKSISEHLTKRPNGCLLKAPGGQPGRVALKD